MLYRDQQAINDRLANLSELRARLSPMKDQIEYLEYSARIDELMRLKDVLLGKHGK